MPKIKLIVEYQGAAFHGWQKQPRDRSVQAELEKIASLVLREPVLGLTGSSRTDSGVHAKGQVVHFVVQQTPDLWRLQHAISNLMRGELAVLEATIVEDYFHARRDAICKQYTYTILHRSVPAVLDHGKAWHVPQKLDLPRLAKEAASIVGQHDFRSFQASGCQAKSTVRTIIESEISIKLPYIYYRVVGNGFLKQMVRTLVGTMIAQASGKIEPTLLELIELKDRRMAGLTAPAHGLCLDWVKY